MNRVDHWVKILQDNGCRITAPRRAILQVVAGSTRALQPADVYELSRVKQPGIGLVTVYRTLERLEELGLIQRVHRDDGCHMLMPAANGHEHYLVCTHCGRTILFEGDDLGALFSRVETRTGYQVSDHWLQLFGTCPQCRAEKS
jgi:Fur family ferric uptake transcriptional regulator